MQCSQKKSCQGEHGYVLLTVLLLLLLMILAMAAAVPAAKIAIKRDKEQELIHRGNQYARAIGRYYRRFGRYPANLEQLENTNNMRFLRKRYKDPMTGKDDWNVLHFGEVQLKTPGINGPGTTSSTGNGASLGGSSTTSGGLQGISANPITTSGGAQGVSGSPSSSSGSPNGSDTSSSAGTKESAGGLSNRRFGGGPIVGVASSNEQESLKELNGKDHYNEWQFVYDPTQDPSMRRALGTQGITGATPAGQFNTAPAPQGPTGFGSGPGMGAPGTTSPGTGGPGATGPGGVQPTTPR